MTLNRYISPIEDELAEFRLQRDFGGEVATLDGQEAGEGVTLAPFGIKIMKITGSGATGADPGRPGP